MLPRFAGQRAWPNLTEIAFFFYSQGCVTSLVSHCDITVINTRVLKLVSPIFFVSLLPLRGWIPVSDLLHQKIHCGNWFSSSKSLEPHKFIQMPSKLRGMATIHYFQLLFSMTPIYLNMIGVWPRFRINKMFRMIDNKVLIGKVNR